MELSALEIDGITVGPRQTSLLALGSADLPGGFHDVHRTDLGAGAWIDHAPNWLPGADEWFEQVTAEFPWMSATRPMYDRIVAVPRLIANVTRGKDDISANLEQLASLFDDHYGRRFGSIGANWYRSGGDSVAIHRDKVKRPADAIIAIVSVGERRPFVLKPDGGGQTLHLQLGDGDLLVMGGTTQQHWQHGVPKTRAAGSRVSIMFRA
ncbi:MAG: alpha-ketoglutarate-dependent dioxygenase AlkB [Acidimicrobiales bacterium]|nr:alpha-ketoglutarate-dependent dioxygenase AlkB [Acidimicrobiales bacterium]RZV48793.1 MAG: alpha-ketoglutarate-dependent dioxygenase AlkB [Acidimicrobiales bacterium]